MIKNEFLLLWKMPIYSVNLTMFNFIEIVNKGLFKAEKGLENYLKAYKIDF